MADEEVERLMGLVEDLRQKVEAKEIELANKDAEVTRLGVEIERLNRVLDQIPLDLRQGYETLAARAYVQPVWNCGRRGHLHSTRDEAERCVASVYYSAEGPVDASQPTEPTGETR